MNTKEENIMKAKNLHLDSILVKIDKNDDYEIGSVKKLSFLFKDQTYIEITVKYSKHTDLISFIAKQDDDKLITDDFVVYFDELEGKYLLRKLVEDKQKYYLELQRELEKEISKRI